MIRFLLITTICICLLCNIIMPRELWAFISEDEYDTIKTTLATGTLTEQLNTINRIQQSGLPLKVVRDLLSPSIISTDMRVQMAAIRVLYQLGDDEVLNILYRYIDDTKWPLNVTLRAINMLYAIGDETVAMQMGIYVKKDNQPDVNIALMRMMLKYRVFADLDATFQSLLEEYVRQGSQDVKLQVLTMIAAYSDAAVPFVKIALDDTNEIVYAKAFEMAQSMASSQIKETIRRYIKSDDLLRVYYAAYTLGLFGEDSYFRYIEKDLTDNDPSVRMRALTFLFNQIGKGADQRFLPLVKRIARSENNQSVKDAALRYVKWAEQILGRKTS